MIGLSYRKMVSNRKTLLAVSCLPMFGCSAIEAQLCGCQESGNNLSEINESLTIGDQNQNDGQDPKHLYLYSRSKYLTEVEDNKPDGDQTLHLCAYLAAATTPFDSIEKLQAEMKANPKVAEVEALYPYYTSVNQLSKSLPDWKMNNQESWTSLAVHRIHVHFGELDDLFAGEDFRIHDFRLTYAALVYAPQGKKHTTENSPAVANTLDVKLIGLSSKAISRERRAEFIRTATSNEPELLGGFFKQAGMKYPPESILRLPIDKLAEYPCPEY